MSTPIDIDDGVVARPDHACRPCCGIDIGLRASLDRGAFVLPDRCIVFAAVPGASPRHTTVPEVPN